MKGIVQEENLNITKVLAELSPEQIQIFNNCFKLIIPNNLLKWFQDLHQDSGNSDNVLIHCGEWRSHGDGPRRLSEAGAVRGGRGSREDNPRAEEVQH